jgi:hypothetical protein
VSARDPGPNPAVAVARPLPARRRSRLHIGPIPITPISTVVAIAFVGSIAVIGWAVLRVRDTSQIPILSSGFAILGVALVVIAGAALLGMWRAARRGRPGGAIALAILGGVVGLGAMGCFTVTVLLALLWKS